MAVDNACCCLCCCVAVVLATAADVTVFAASAFVFAVSACVLNVCVSFFISFNSVLYVVYTCCPNDDDDKLVSANLTPFTFNSLVITDNLHLYQVIWI